MTRPPRDDEPSTKRVSAQRRALLSALGATTATGLAGCIGDYPSAAPAPETDGSSDSATDATETGTTNGTRGTTTETPPSDFVRRRGDPVSVERATTDESGYDDDIEYFPSNETIRYVAARSRDSPAAFETISFGEWSSIECASAATERTREVTADRHGTDEFGSGTGVAPEGADADELVVRLRVATRIEDGETVSTPSASRDQLADVAPRSVEATVSLDGDEFSRTVPVFAQHVEMGTVMDDSKAARCCL